MNYLCISLHMKFNNQGNKILDYFHVNVLGNKQQVIKKTSFNY